MTINSFSSQGSPIITTQYGILDVVGSESIFILKYNSNGQAQWATRLNSPSGQESFGIKCDSNNNVYVNGYHSDDLLTLNNFESVGTPINLTEYGTLSESGGSYFLVKYNSTGQVEWVVSIIGDIYGSSGLTIDNNDFIYLSGIYGGPITIQNFVSGGSPIILSEYGTLLGTGITSSYLIKYNSVGKVQWATNILNSSAESPLGAKITNDTDNNIYLLTSTNENCTIQSFESKDTSINLTVYGILNTTDNVQIIVKYNTDGVAQWVTRVYPLSGSNLFFTLPITTDKYGNIYVTGQYNSNPLTINTFKAVGNPIELDTYGTLTKIGTGNDTFVIRYNKAGQM
jgi:nitrogen regulatory protein PII-like uncharacterized protein